jgi:hypothetical protein
MSGIFSRTKNGFFDVPTGFLDVRSNRPDRLSVFYVQNKDVVRSNRPDRSLGFLYVKTEMLIF